jgi:hypothetical protein
MHTYLLVNKICPESGLGSLVRIRRQERGLSLPYIVNILNNNKGLTNWSSIVDESWELLGY